MAYLYIYIFIYIHAVPAEWGTGDPPPNRQTKHGRESKERGREQKLDACTTPELD